MADLSTRNPKALRPVFRKSCTCRSCQLKFNKFSLTKNRHHCRNCGESVCGSCLAPRLIKLPWFAYFSLTPVCRLCYDHLHIHAAKLHNTTNPPPLPQKTRGKKLFTRSCSQPSSVVVVRSVEQHKEIEFLRQCQRLKNPPPQKKKSNKLKQLFRSKSAL